MIGIPKKKQKNAPLSAGQDLINIDIVKEKLLLLELAASRGFLIEGIAHEISSPLSYVSSNMETLSDYLNNLKSILELQDKIISSTNKNDLIKTELNELNALKEKCGYENMLEDIRLLLEDLSKGVLNIKKNIIDLKSISPAKELDEVTEVDINQLLDRVLNILKNELKYKCTVKITRGEIPSIRCFENQIIQILISILLNAEQAIKGKGEISISTESDGQFISIKITDTGTGISEKTKIFTPFYTTKSNGTGLGLFICKEIVKNHFGNIDFTSNTSGTTLMIQLPIKKWGLYESKNISS